MNTIAKIGLDCVGCRSCEQSCPQGCIAMKSNQEGFLYPVIHQSSCIQCGMCLRSCPVHVSLPEERRPLAVYACKQKDQDALFRSASGGASDAAVRSVLQRGGVAYGAAYDANLTVGHIEVTAQEDRRKLQSSKYVQSDLRDSFSRARRRLQEGKIVLFTGTPCQIAGLYAFLGKPMEGLYTIDLICHGVPSPELFAQYLRYQGQKLGEPVEQYSFRAKDRRGWGTQYLLQTESKTKSQPLALDKYGNHFFAGDCYRECCYRCRYAGLNRPADLTLGDFWGIEKSHPDFNEPLGVSAVLVNTEKGQQLLSWMQESVELMPASLEQVLQKQENLRQATPRPRKRDTFYRNLKQPDFFAKISVGFQWKERIKQLLPPETIRKIKRHF